MGDPKTIQVMGVEGGGTVDATFKAEVTPPTFSPWTITAGAGGTGDPSGVVQEQDGVLFPVTYTPDPGFEIDTISVNGVAV